MGKTRVRVTAEDTVVGGHRFGEEFDIDDDDGINVEALVQGGHVEVVGGKGKSSDKAKEE